MAGKGGTGDFPINTGKSLVSYLRLRAGGGHAPWRKLAEQAGLTAENLAAIETAITGEREALIRREYDYATGRHDIRDGSPTFVWESERLADLKKIEVFKDIESASQGRRVRNEKQARAGENDEEFRLLLEVPANAGADRDVRAGRGA